MVVGGLEAYMAGVKKHGCRTMLFQSTGFRKPIHVSRWAARLGDPGGRVPPAPGRLEVKPLQACARRWGAGSVNNVFGRHIYEAPEAYGALCIHPEARIDRGACVPACPVSAGSPEEDAPEQWNSFIDLNYKLAGLK